MASPHAGARPARFAALRAPWYKGYVGGGTLLMAGDNAEHTLTYWVMWQEFHSPLLAGFAVVSHWVPHLLLSVPFGALADRVDNRRIIQAALGLFMLAWACWAMLIVTGTLQPWHCIPLLIVHGLASALWQPADKVLLYDMVGTAELPSAVRLMATGISLGQLIGPAFGALLLFTLGPGIGMFVNVLLYVPFLIYLFVIPLDGHGRDEGRARRRVAFRETLGVVRELPRYPAIMIVFIAQAAVGLLIGTALMPLLPDFGTALGLDASGVGYGLLVAATAVGAVAGGIALEATGRIRASARIAVLSTAALGVALVLFALSSNTVVAITALALSGVATIVSNSTAQTVVQLEAPADRQGVFAGASQMTSMGSRVGSGFLMGGLAATLGVGSAVVIAGVILATACVALFMAAELIGRRATRARTLDLDEDRAATR